MLSIAMLGFIILSGATTACYAQLSGDTTPQYSIEQLMDVVEINGGAFSLDETKVLINSRKTGIFNAFEISLNPGNVRAEPKQITFSTEESVFSRSYFPLDNRILYVADKGGNGNTHLFVRNQNGTVYDIIKDSSTKAEFAGWAYDK